MIKYGLIASFFHLMLVVLPSDKLKILKEDQ